MQPWRMNWAGVGPEVGWREGGGGICEVEEEEDEGGASCCDWF